MKQWLDFLDTQTPEALRDNNSICALPRMGIVYVGGEDASDFLQNQLSNDITHIDANHWQMSSCSNSKGRMYAIFRVAQIEGGYLLLMDSSIVSDVIARLQKFVLMAKVVLADISQSFACTSITTDSAEIVSNPDYPDEIHQVRQTDSLITMRLQSVAGRTRFLMLSNDANEAIELWKALSQNLAVNDSAHWKLQEIESAIPTLYSATQDAFVLQMCNLDALDGVNFKKGCYPGQEVVARTHYLGKLKRRMFLAQIQSDECPLAGHELTTAGQAKGDGSGKIVDAVYTGDNTCLALFVAVMAKAEAGELRLLDHPDSVIKTRPLPYEFAESKP